MTITDEDTQRADRIKFAQDIALRDINMTGEFSNPFKPIKERIEYQAYETVRRHFCDQMDLDIETQLRGSTDESSPPNQQL